MSPLRINGSTSGSVSLDCPAVGGNNTLVLPGGNGSAGQYLQTNGSGTLSWAGVSGLPAQALTLGTAVASTSGTSIDFTGIPSTVKRVTIIFDGVSVSGSSIPVVQLGTSSGFTASGYTGAAGGSDTASGNSVSANTNGLRLMDTGNGGCANRGLMQIILISSNTWISSHAVGDSAVTRAYWGGGSIALSGTLDRVRITTVNGTDTFDAGTINIMYEG